MAFDNFSSQYNEKGVISRSFFSFGHSFPFFFKFFFEFKMKIKLNYNGIYSLELNKNKYLAMKYLLLKKKELMTLIK